MFTPGRTPGQLDRRATGQRLLSQIIPKLQSFRQQAGLKAGGGLAPTPDNLPPGLMRPTMPGLSNALGKPGGMGGKVSLPGASMPTVAPPPPSAAGPRPGGAPVGGAAFGPGGSGQITGGGQAVPGLRAATGSEIPIFLRWLAEMAARGEGGDTLAQAGRDTAGGAHAGGGGGSTYA